MRRGRLSNQPSPELWVLDEALFSDDSPEPSQSKLNALWEMCEDHRLVLVWLEVEPFPHGLDYFAQEVRYKRWSQLLTKFRRSARAALLVVSDSARLGVSGVIQGFPAKRRSKWTMRDRR